MPGDASERLRTICLALPEATEVLMRRGPTFRVADRIFAWDRPWRGAASVWCKVPPGSQAVLVGADPARFFVPPFVGTKGWIGVRLDDTTDWDEVTALVRRSHRLIAPPRLRTLVP